jgi:hypothetical protein
MKSFSIRYKKYRILLVRSLTMTDIIVLNDETVDYRFDVYDHKNLVLPIELQSNGVWTVTDLKKYIEIHGKEIDFRSI